MSFEVFVRAYLRRPQGRRSEPIEGVSGVTTSVLNQRRIRGHSGATDKVLRSDVRRAGEPGDCGLNQEGLRSRPPRDKRRQRCE